MAWVSDKLIEGRSLLRDPRSGPVIFAVSFVFLVCLSVVILEATQIMSARDVEIEERETEATNLAKSLADHASNVMLQVQLRLSGIVERLETDGMNEHNLSRIQNLFRLDMSRLPQLQRLSVVDRQGHVITTDSKDQLDLYLPRTDREYFIYHATHESKEPHLGMPIKSRSTNQWVFTISQRFNDSKGQFAGVVLASLNINFFTKYYQQFEIGKDGTTALIMTNGTILNRRPFVDSVIGSNVKDGPLFSQHINKGETEGTTWGRSRIDGVERLTAYRKLNLFPVYAVVSFSKQEMLRDWLMDSVVHSIIALILVSILAFVGRKLVSQIHKSYTDQQLLLQSSQELQILNKQLEDMTRVDSLTEMSNRRDFDRVLLEEIRKFHRNGGYLSLIMLDIDYFKSYNDYFGHPKGDECLRLVADKIRENTNRPGDFSARYGGEEFVVLLPATDSLGALKVAQQIQVSINQMKIFNPDGVNKIVTVSMGIGTLSKNDYETPNETLLSKADRALYSAKHKGRNAIYLCDEVLDYQRVQSIETQGT